MEYRRKNCTLNFQSLIFFGGNVIITENDPVEQERRIRYNDFVAYAVIFQNVVAITMIL
nr:transposase [Bacillus cereus]